MQFLGIIGGWINRYFSNEEAVYLIVLIVAVMVTLLLLGGVLAPVLTGLVIAFILEGFVKKLVGLNLPRMAAIVVTFVLFLGAVVAIVLFVVPLLWQQLRALVEAMPNIMVRLQEISQDLTTAFPELLTQTQIDQWLEGAAGQIAAASGAVVETVFNQAPTLVALLIYLVLVPISIFFFLKDRETLIQFVGSLLPSERPLLNAVGAEMNVQLANYVRGKFIEILIVGGATFVTFTVLGLNYAALLGVLVGLSVLIPFVGAAVVTIPVALVGLIQFGWSLEFVYVMAAYAVIQALDGNVLVPLLFSEAVDLHPIMIIIAVLAFGGIWGVWGVFFAIPLATLVKGRIHRVAQGAGGCHPGTVHRGGF